jgi:AraC-like DNA-binding protein
MTRKSIEQNHQRVSRRPEIKIWHVENVGEVTRSSGLWEPTRKMLYPYLSMCVLETGTIKGWYRHQNHTLESGRLILCQPDEVCGSEPVAGGGHTIRLAVSCSAEMFQKAANDISDKRTPTPFLADFVKADAYLARLFVEFFRSLERPASQLERSSKLGELLTEIVFRRTSPPPPQRRIKSERGLVKRVREYLDGNCTDNISLERLAALVNVSPFHLNRVFRNEVGIPPHAYQTQVRVHRSKSLLARGVSIEQTALEVGFFDQSHFTKHFKRMMGFTPGVYQDNLCRQQFHPSNPYDRDAVRLL